MFLFIVSFQQGPCIRSLRGPRAWLKGHLMLAPVAQLDRALPSETEGQALNWLRRTGIEVRRFSELAKFGKRT